jgi:G3E family GTPase
MNNGCICCTVRGDLIRVISGLMKRAAAFDGILIETTGLADPGPVAQTFFADEEIASKTRIDSIVTVVDAKHLPLRLRDSKEAEEQIAFADVILLNKADLVSPEGLARIEDSIHAVNHYAKIIRTTRCDAPLDKILGLGSFDLDAILKRDPDFLKGNEEEHHHGHECGCGGGCGCGHHHEHEHRQEHDTTISSLSLRAEKPLDPARFEEWIGALRANKGQDLLRYKGILDLVGSERQLVIQGVHMMIDGTNMLPWKDGEKRASRLVFIGRGLDEKELREGFERCVA